MQYLRQLSLLLSITLVAAAPQAAAVTELNTLAQQHGKVYFGSATDNPELTNAPYVAILSDRNMFGQTTATNSMKWVRIQRSSESDMLMHTRMTHRTRRNRLAESLLLELPRPLPTLPRVMVNSCEV